MDRELSTSNSNKTQQHDEQNFPLRLIIGRLMFTYGDSDEPMGICQEFLGDLLHGQLKMLINKAHKLSIERNSQSIGFPEFMFAFRRHPVLIRRLIGYMRLIDLIFRPHEGKQIIETLESVLPLANSTLIDRNILGDPKLKNTRKVINAVRLIDVMGHLLADIDENSLNVAKMERMRRMEARTRQMDAELYERFAEARRTSFCNWTGRRWSNGASKFLGWLETPPMEEGLANALNFCAMEIVAIVVESAVRCRDQENHQDVKERKENHSIHPSEPLERPKALYIRHYEEAVRRNWGYAKRKDILFGYF